MFPFEADGDVTVSLVSVTLYCYVTLCDGLSYILPCMLLTLSCISHCILTGWEWGEEGVVVIPDISIQSCSRPAVTEDWLSQINTGPTFSSRQFSEDHHH